MCIEDYSYILLWRGQVIVRFRQCYCAARARNNFEVNQS
jgi:hypothetical protein